VTEEGQEMAEAEIEDALAQTADDAAAAENDATEDPHGHLTEQIVYDTADSVDSSSPPEARSSSRQTRRSRRWRTPGGDGRGLPGRRDRTVAETPVESTEAHDLHGCGCDPGSRDGS
jgi:hypothetical protein